VIRQIFRWFTLGRSPRRIAFDLNHAGIFAPGGNGWGASTINGNGARGTGILNNELYIGRLVWNRLRYLKDPITGKRVSRLNPQSEWIIREVPELRILDQDLWESVKSRQLASKRYPTRSRPRTGILGANKTQVSPLRSTPLRSLWRCIHKNQRQSVRLCHCAQQGHLQ
jgi:hypothetical protein